MNDKLLTEYMIGRYRQGYDYIAIYLAATLFERLMKTKLNQKNAARYQALMNHENQVDLIAVIDAIGDQMGLNSRYGVNEETKLALDEVFRFGEFFGVRVGEHAVDMLHCLRQLRNGIIHADDLMAFLEDHDNSRHTFNLMLYLVSENSPALFEENLSRIRERTHSGLALVMDSKHADYLVRSVDEIMIKRLDETVGPTPQGWCIEERDLGNLLHLREKMVPLKNSLDIWLKDYYPNLSTTILTTIDTTSAYIWLPIIHNRNCHEDIDRPNLESATASILATPMDLRIYIDFGGQCYEDRKKYFQFIKRQNGNFKKFISELEGSERENFIVFDVEWYSFISKRRPVDTILHDWNTWDEAVTKAEEELEALNKDPIITTNRLLSGFVFDRDWLKENGPLGEDFFHEKLTQIIDLYYSLLLSENG